MMVLLSTLAASAGISGHGAFGQRYAPAVLSGIVVCAWHIPCSYLYKRSLKLMNNETMLVTSIGLCLGMVVLATHLASSALGAFIMGSLIAEAPNSEKSSIFSPR